MIDKAINLEKQKDTTNRLDDAIAELVYYSRVYPIDAVEFIISHKADATPKLLELLKNTLEYYETLGNNYFGHIHAMFILAQFRETQAFNYVIGIAALPDKWPETLLEYTITEDLHNLLASVYDGNLQKIKDIIENPNANTWSRNAALKSLLVLVKERSLEREEIINYIKSLFAHPSFRNDQDATTYLVNSACDLYPKEVYKEIVEAFQDGLVDNFSVDMKWVDEVLTLGEDVALKRYLYGYSGYGFITDAINCVQWWACFQEQEDSSPLFEDNDFASTPEPFRIESPKVGRNDPCPCGSGKKFKKCCLH